MTILKIIFQRKIVKRSRNLPRLSFKRGLNNASIKGAAAKKNLIQQATEMFRASKSKFSIAQLGDTHVGDVVRGNRGRLWS